MEVMTSFLRATMVRSFKSFNNRIEAVLRVAIVLIIQRDNQYPNKEDV